MSFTGSLPRLAPQVAAAARTWERAAWVAGLFTLLVGAVILIGHLDNPTLEALNSAELKALKARLRDNPADETLKQQIRERDLQLRAVYFRQLAQTHSGVYLLLGGAGLFVLAVARRATLVKQLPMPAPRPDADVEATAAAARARWALGTGAAAVAALLFVAALGFRSGLPATHAGLEKFLAGGEPAAATQPDAAPAAEMKRNWPRFRGYQGAGLCSSSNVPTTWDAKTGAGMAWKIASPGTGFNSPIIWSDRVFFSGGDAAVREVFCLDLKDGKLLWRQAITNVPGTPQKPPEIPESTGYAAATMGTDGKRVYVWFGNGDTAALSMEGKVVWSKSFGPLKNAYGHATSLATSDDRLILQLDQGEPEDRKSRLYALDGPTGRVVWQKERKVGASWASPIVFAAAGKAQIVALALPAVMSYNAADGSELWKAELLSGEITPSPVFDGTQVVVASPSDKLVAIRPDGTGDVSKSQVVWTNEDNVPDVTSPVSNGDLVFSVTTSGMLSCFDAKDGKKQWEHDYEFECHASPTIANNRVYFIGQKGVAIIVEASRQFKEILKTEVPDAFHATPAFALDKVVFRGVTNIWCFGSAAPAKAGNP